MSHRAERLIEELTDCPDGLTTAQLIIRMKVSRIAPAVHEARKDYGLVIKTEIHKSKFLGLFTREQARYILQTKRS